jgi:hypothetical protein
MDDPAQPPETPGAAEPAPRSPRRSRRRVIVAGALTAAFFLIVGLVLAYKGSTSTAQSTDGESAAAAGDAAAGGVDGATNGPTTTQEPDKLPDPGVSPGTCKMANGGV